MPELFPLFFPPARRIDFPIERPEVVNPERSIAIVCRTDRRSDMTAALLARRGFADVHVVHGGMNSLAGAGLATLRRREPRG